jgi:hypothetical protein
MHWLMLLVSVFFVLAAAAVAAPEAVLETAKPSAAAEQKASSASEAAKEPQSPPPAEGEPKAKKSPAEIRKISDAYYKQCLQDWDAGTHMTKKEWQRTCRRLVDNRVKFMVEEMGK